MDKQTKEIINFIADRVGVESEDITPDSYVEDDLNIGELELIEILEELEEKYGVELMDYKDDFETINDILEQINEKID